MYAQSSSPIPSSLPRLPSPAADSSHVIPFSPFLGCNTPGLGHPPPDTPLPCQAVRYPPRSGASQEFERLMVCLISSLFKSQRADIMASSRWKHKGRAFVGFKQVCLQPPQHSLRCLSELGKQHSDSWMSDTPKSPVGWGRLPTGDVPARVCPVCPSGNGGSVVPLNYVMSITLIECPSALGHLACLSLPGSWFHPLHWHLWTEPRRGLSAHVWLEAMLLKCPQ